MNIIERKNTMETLLRERIDQLQQLENAKNKLTSEILQLQGKVELLRELEKESTSQKIEDKGDNPK